MCQRRTQSLGVGIVVLVRMVLKISENFFDLDQRHGSLVVTGHPGQHRINVLNQPGMVGIVTLPHVVVDRKSGAASAGRRSNRLLCAGYQVGLFNAAGETDI
jgi:hypothetical protein